MTERIPAVGDVVSTPIGERGRIIRPASTTFTAPLEYKHYDLEGEGDLIVYTVLLDGGEVRMYSFEALFG
jgi:hypothetical protein